jgi:hypothetical protein
MFVCGILGAPFLGFNYTTGTGTATTTTNGNEKTAKWKTENGILNTPPFWHPFSTKRGIYGNGNGKSFVSFWIATGLQRAPRNDGNGNDKMENGNGNTETATPHPALSRKGRGKKRRTTNGI